MCSVENGLFGMFEKGAKKLALDLIFSVSENIQSEKSP